MKKTIALFLVTFMTYIILAALGTGTATAADLDRGPLEAAPDEMSGAEEYTFSSVSGVYSEITGGTVSSATGDDGFQDISLPFVFTFDSLTFDTARLSVNGWLQLGQTYAGSGSANDLANADVRPILAPFWDDLYDDSTSEIRYQLLGTSPDRVFVVQWKGVRWSGSAGSRQNFQLRLYENGNKIEFIYGAMSPSTNTSASIGLNGASVQYGKYLSVTPGSPASISSTVVNNNITSVNFLSSGTVYQFTPPCFYLWTGGVSRDWGVPGNWNCNAVPGAANNATVTGSGSNMPVIGSDSALAKLDIDPGNSLTLSGGDLTVEGIRIEGSLTVSGSEVISLSGTNLAWNRLPSSGVFNPGTGLVSFYGSGILTIHADEEFYNLTVESGKTFDPGEYTLVIKGKFTNFGTLWPSNELSEVHFYDLAVNQGVWRGQLSKMIFHQGFENHSSGTIYASQNPTVGNEFQGNVTNYGAFNASETGRLVVLGDWVNNGNFSPGSGTIILARNGKQLFTGGSSDYYNITFEGGADVELKGNLSVLNDLQIQPDAGLDLVGHVLTVDNQLMNFGKAAQTLPAAAGSAVDFLKISNKARTRWVYWGMSLNPDSDMGDTRVVIREFPQDGCSSNSGDALISRCFEIEPQNPANSTIRFYFLASELNGQVLTEMKLWHFETSWSQVGINYTHSEACTPDQLDCWFQADEISNYSLFGLGSGGLPTKIQLSNLTSKQWRTPVVVPVLIGLVSAIVLIIRAANKKWGR